MPSGAGVIYMHVMQVTNRLRQIREERRLSRADVASALRVDSSTIARWEINGSIPTSRVPALAEYLGVPKAHLMGWDDEVPASVAA